MSVPAKRKRITIDTKVSIINAVERKDKRNAQICRDFDIPSSTLYTILKEKEKILSAYTTGEFKGDRKKIQRPDYADLDQALLLFFKQARSQSIPVGGPQLMEKGKEIAEGLGLTNFSMSQGWLDRFKSRHGISMKDVCGESSAVDQQLTDDWKTTTLQPLLEQYRPSDVFNADETGLFYKCLPSRTLSFKGENCSGGKLPKDQITLLVAANMDGSEKLPLLVIGKFDKPRCLKNIKSLPTSYRANKKAWMTGKIFEEWLRKLDRSFLLQGRSILLVLDNCTAHPHITDLKAVNLVFQPPNTTSVLQPCDQGIIQNLKTLYRKRILRRLVGAMSNGDGKAHLNMTVLDAMTTAAAAWEDVKSETIANCFRHAGFVTNETEALIPNADDHQQSDLEMVHLFSQIENAGALQDYLHVDDQVQSTEHMSTQEIIDKVRADDEIEDEDVDDSEIIPPVSSKSAAEAITTLRQFLLQQNNGDKLLKGAKPS